MTMRQIWAACALALLGACQAPDPYERLGQAMCDCAQQEASGIETLNGLLDSKSADSLGMEERLLAVGLGIHIQGCAISAAERMHADSAQMAYDMAPVMAAFAKHCPDAERVRLLSAGTLPPPH